MINNKKLPYIIGGVVVLLLLGFLFISSQSNQPTPATNVATGSANTATTSKDPQDIVPGLYKNLIQNSATKEGFVIASTTVENNVDSTGKTVSDHLELSLKNTSGSDLTGFEVYYTITDSVTGKKEGYYKKLDGFTLNAGQTQNINFDNLSGNGHFYSNKNSIYYTSYNKLNFDVMVSTPGFKVQTSQIVKSAGGAETKD